MTMAICFWVLMIFWLILGVWRSWPVPADNPNYWPVGGNLLLFILIAMLGWHVFGSPIKG